MLMDMDESDWDDEPSGVPDWVLDGTRGPDSGGEGADVGERPGISEIRERHRKAYDRWTPKAEADLVAAYLAGQSIDQLAADFERQPSAIRRRLEKAALAEMDRKRANPDDSEPS
jgi:hypothetical protein